ncbi:uncharacterized protein PV06_03918 [Exophiala oligosperma]|uniref:Uncharacterized protein n=1 Tax=Exophiala oligosperma TaxID=215243 RepID=A0A0D2EC71_9EURO|nr:uncharacterized protein PV06_03918 [Exophiala oligosperma]KIW45534.1 hypothetical protein PV06_03918 [Exophiala oligosperma]
MSDSAHESLAMKQDRTHRTKSDHGSAFPTQVRDPLLVAQLPIREVTEKNIRRVLIANRGEIACRIIATCRKLDLTSIAIFADEDSTSLHVTAADEAVNLGSVSQTEGNPFLNVQLLVKIALSQNADAIHPGYGYLSENETFADAVRQAGMIFIGPSSEAMSTLGDKRNSKEYLKQYAPSVPLIPGYAGSSQDVADLERAAEKVGFPVMLKASAGGGGRGMRIVRERSQLAGELARAQSEAKRSFGSSDCILEKYIEAAKHIEVQIMGDNHGKVISLWERECSVQRRHQKIIEETPSPFLTSDQRQRMCAVAVQIGELIGYEGAGTVEFVVDAKDGSFYFLEVNTRLQVEHPITEEVTGVDIVALQLFVAAGGSLTSVPWLQQEVIPQNGHAIECRLCAEDPNGDFMPQNGTIRLWRESDQYRNGASRDIRYETAIKTGSEVSIHFDSMIAKVVVWAPTRDAAIRKMVRVLATTACAGVKTNQLFLQACLLHNSFQDPAYTTSLIPTYLQGLLRNPHVNATSDMMTMLSVIPGLFRRATTLDQRHKTSGPFQNVRVNFRNQFHDPVNVSTTITVPTAEPPKPILSVWKASSSGQGCCNPSFHVTVAPIPDNTSKEETETVDSTTKTTTPARELSRQYHAISRKLRDGSLATATQYTVQLRKYQSKQINDDSGSDWQEGSATVAINNSTIQVYVASNISSSSSQGTTADASSFLCHLPSLGTWVGYTCHTLLNYIETLRPSLSGSVVGSSNSKIIKAPMPCKVLSVLKQNGEEVKAGQVVLVIESMKMETNISVNIAGKFGTNVKVGDSVDDGKVLCWVE